MKCILHPWQLLLVILSGWVNRNQLAVIEYLRTENRILKETHGGKRILLNDDQRRILAVKGKVLGRKVLQEIATIVTPDTIMRWHRQLVAANWDYSARRKKKVGRPQVQEEVVELALRMAKENPGWGYDRIQGALANLGYRISDTTVGNILRAHGIEPAPERKTTNYMVHVYQSTLGLSRWHRFHNRRRMGKARTRHFLFALCHQNIHATGSIGWLHCQSTRSMDEADG